ncbi:MAG: asparagine synthase (glutamine-hydrolyzing) [Crocinitomicaceae bacterium]
MCGINGIFKFSGQSYSPSIIKEMNSALERRGPDAEGIYTDDFVMLGHRRLSIIDPTEHSNQPMTSNDGRYILVFNGEIYNYRAIREKLKTYAFKTDSDTEVVLAAYIDYGERCVNHFNGMFAFAIWDKEENKMFMARDRMGIKPLYYVLTDEQLIFSSSLKAILETNLLERKLNKNGLVDYLRYQCVHAPYTIVEGVFMLMPGQRFSVGESHPPTYDYYWKLTDQTLDAGRSVSEVQKNVREKLNESVQKRLMADVPYGAFLSGGIDSSIIVGIMAKEMDRKVDTFSVVFSNDQLSEAPYSRLIADRFQTNHHEIELSPERFLEMMPEALDALDHPSGDGLNTYVVSKKTREAGIIMALSGLGGDELFGGYSVFQQIPNLQDKKWLSSFAVNFRKLMGGAYHSLKGSVASAKMKGIMEAPNFDLEYVYPYYRRVLMDDNIKKILKEKALPENVVMNQVHDMVGFNKPGWSLHPLSRISVAEMTTYMQNVLLRDTDQMSMANSLEVRVPFLDHEFVGYVLGIRDAIKNPTPPKQLLINSFSEILPKEIYERPKMGFVLPYEQWMKTTLRAFCEERLDELKKNGYFRDKELDELWNRFIKGDKMITWSRIWHLVILGDWMKRNGVS